MGRLEEETPMPKERADAMQAIALTYVQSTITYKHSTDEQHAGLETLILDMTTWLQRFDGKWNSTNPRIALLEFKAKPNKTTPSAYEKYKMRAEDELQIGLANPGKVVVNFFQGLFDAFRVGKTL